MKKLIQSGIMSLAILLFITSSAWCLTIQGGTIEVGGLDTLVTSGDLSNSGDSSELTWVQSVIGGIPDLSAKYDTDGLWMPTDQSGVYAIDLRSTDKPYFYIKTGNIGGPDHFLFLNNDASGWGVINLATLGISTSQISHVGVVPEPATMLLFGAGLIGIVGIGRRRLKA